MKNILSCFLSVVLLAVTLNANAVLRAVGGGGGGTIGGPVTGGTNNQVLYVNSSGNLSGSANLTFNGTILTAAGLTVTGAISGSPANANVTFSPTGTGTVAINPATAGTMDNVTIGGSTSLAGTFSSITTGGTLFLKNGVSAIGNIIGNVSGNTIISSTVANAKLIFQTNTIANTIVLQDGAIPSLSPGNGSGTVDLGTPVGGWKRLYIDYTNTATVGNVTINKVSGRVNLAAAGTTLTVTNSLVTAASHCFLNSDGAPGNAVAVQFYAVPAAGSFTVNAVPAVTNQTAIDFFCVNAD